MSKDDLQDLGVPARVADGWRYVVSLKSGERRYFHAPWPLARIREMHLQAIEKKFPFLTLEGAKWVLEDGGPDCAGYVVVGDISALGYATPADVLAIDGAIAQLDALAAEQEKRQEEATEGEQGDEAGDQALRAMSGQGWPLNGPPTPTPPETPTPSDNPLANVGQQG